MTSNADHTQIVIETFSCRVVGHFRELRETDGARLYDVDASLTECDATAESYTVTSMFDENTTISWGPTSLKFMVSGEASIPVDDWSLILFYFESF